MELTRINTPWFNPLNSARRVLFCYNLFHKPPVVHLELSERNEGNNFAEVTGATRYLAALGLRALLDASPNSLPPEALATKRQVRDHSLDLILSLGTHNALTCTHRSKWSSCPCLKTQHTTTRCSVPCSTHSTRRESTTWCVTSWMACLPTLSGSWSLCCPLSSSLHLTHSQTSRPSTRLDHAPFAGTVGTQPRHRARQAGDGEVRAGRISRRKQNSHQGGRQAP
jgi:hypothetical protein